MNVVIIADVVGGGGAILWGTLRRSDDTNNLARLKSVIFRTTDASKQ